MAAQDVHGSVRFEQVGAMIQSGELDEAYVVLRELIREEEAWAAKVARASWFPQIADHPGFTALVALEPSALALRAELKREHQDRRLRRGFENLSSGAPWHAVVEEWLEVLQLAEACEHHDVQVRAHALLCWIFTRPESRNTEVALAHGRQAVALAGSSEVGLRDRVDALVQLGHARFEAGDVQGGEHSHAQARAVTP